MVGRVAEELSGAHPESSLQAPKSRLGDQAPVVLNGRPYPVVNLVAAVLAHVAAKAVAQFEIPPRETRLTHPATWNRLRINRLVEAAGKAGLANVTLVSEPVAAAFTYASDTGMAPGEHVAVYDLGGGTFDTAVVEAVGAGFAVVGRAGGDVSIGGDLFDEMLANHIGERLDPEVWEQIQVAGDWSWQRVATTLRSQTRRAKEMLSAYPYADVVLPLPTGLVLERVTREEYEELIGAHIDETISLLGRTIANAGLTPQSLTAIYLVGGASRAPIVERLAAEAFPGLTVSRRGEPKSCVALGAVRGTGVAPSAVLTGGDGSSEDSRWRGAGVQSAEVPVVGGPPSLPPPVAPPPVPPPPVPSAPLLAGPATIGPETFLEQHRASTPPVGGPATPVPAAGPGRAGPGRAGPGPAGPGPARKRRRVGWFVLAALVLLAAGVAGVAILATGGKSDTASASEIFLETVTAPGPNPFTSSLVIPDLSLPDLTKISFPSIPGLATPELTLPKVSIPEITLPGITASEPTAPAPTAAPTGSADGTGGISSVAGSVPGLYGGTRIRTLCDVKQLVSFLATNADKAAAWAKVQGITVDQIPQYVASLTSVLLGHDTRVTNFGFKNGTAPANNAILQAGTAVLVDPFGVPRVRCFCGNPLGAPQPIKKPTYTGDRWPGFTPGTVIVVTPSPQPQTSITIIDVFTNSPVELVTGTPLVEPTTTPTTSPSDVASTTLEPASTGPPTTASPSSTSTSTTATPTTAAPAPVNVTPSGIVSSSSDYPGGHYPTSAAIDGDPSTSWFSAGLAVDGPTARYTWTASGGQPIRISSITILSNALNADPSVRKGFGFGQVIVEVQDAAHNVVFTQTVPLPGDPNPTVVVNPDVPGVVVNLLFSQHQSKDCGGFGELIVLAQT